MGNVLHIALKVWNVIVTSNLFNFVIFLYLFALIFKKINLKGMIANLQQKIENTIELAKKEKSQAVAELRKAESAVANLDEEVKVIVEDAHKSAEVISNKIASESKKQLENIEANAVKVINAEEKLLISKLTKNTSSASVKVAQAHIEKTLAQTPSLHEKYINESIEELDRLSF